MIFFTLPGDEPFCLITLCVMVFVINVTAAGSNDDGVNANYPHSLGRQMVNVIGC